MRLPGFKSLYGKPLPQMKFRFKLSAAHLLSVVLAAFMIAACQHPADEVERGSDSATITAEDAEEGIYENDFSNFKADYGYLEEMYKDLGIKALSRTAERYILEKRVKEGMYVMYMIVERDNARRLTEKQEREYLLLANINLGFLWMSEYKNPVIAYYHLIRGKNLLEELAPSNMVDRTSAAFYNNLGHIYTAFGELGLAFDNFKTSFHLSKSNSNEEAYITAFVDLVQCAWLVDSVASIKPEIESFMRHKKLAIPTLNRYSFFLARAARSKLAGDAPATLSNLDSAYLSLETPFFRERYETLNRLVYAKSAAGAGYPALTASALSQADSVIRAHSIDDLAAILLRMQSEQALRTGDRTLALDKMQRALVLQDSLFGLQKYGMLLDVKSAVENAHHEKELALSEAKSTQREHTIILLSVLAVVLVLGTAWILYQYSRLRVSNRELFKKNLELMKQGDSHEEPLRKEPAHIVEEKDTGMEASDKEMAGNDRELEMLNGIFDRIREHISSTPDVYAPEFSIDTLAASTGIKARMISQAINKVTGKNFNAYIADIRIRQACRILLGAQGARRPTVEVVAEQVGYQSRSHFSRVFKSVTGLTVTEFLYEASRMGEEQD